MIDPRSLQCHGWLEYLYRGVEKLPGVRRLIPAQWIKLCLLDFMAQRKLRDCNVLNGWSGMCLRTFEQGRRRGAVNVLQTGSAHATEQKRLIEAELATYGLRQRATPDRVLDRQLREYALADYFVVPSSFVRRTFAAMGVNLRRIKVIPEGVDCSSLRPQLKRDGAFRVLYMGHLSFRKGVAHLLAAAELLKDSGIEFVLRGAIEPGFDRVLSRYEGLFRRVGRVPSSELSDFISQASVVVVPSIEDGWCAVTVEAMACAVPVIVSGNAGSADAVRCGMDGFVVPAGDAKAIVDRLRWLQSHPAERARMGCMARERAREFNWDTYRRKISAFLTQCSDRVQLPLEGATE